jgi:hypothetical protein
MTGGEGTRRADAAQRPEGSAWQMGDCAKDDARDGVETEGVADDSTIYVNGKSELHT